MRKNKLVTPANDFSILTVDDDEVMTITLQAYFRSSGFQVDIENDPMRSIERVRAGHYDILLLDFLMRPICGDEVVAQIRAFNKDIFIILLTGHKSMAPPIKTIRDLDIQGYYEKSDKFDQLELLVESCVKSIRHMRTICSYRDGLQDMLNSIPSLYGTHTIEGLIQEIIAGVAEIFRAKCSVVYLDAEALDEAAAFIAKDSEKHYFFSSCGDYADGREGAFQLYQAVKEGESEMRGFLIAPLVSEKGSFFGAIGIDLEDEEKDIYKPLFEMYARQAGAALSNGILDALVKLKNEELRLAYGKLHDNYVGMIDTMRSMVDAKDIYTRGHSDRVSHYAGLIARAMGRDETYAMQIELAGLFHDIGKIGTADAILLKPDKLTAEEFEEVKKHPQLGTKMLAGLPAFEGMPEIIESHHERFDGRGYPNGRKGKEIPEEARIICAADAFDAMTSNRRYRKGLTFDAAVMQLEQGKGTQFDPEVVDAFLEVLKDYDNIRRKLAWTFGDADHE